MSVLDQVFIYDNKAFNNKGDRRKWKVYSYVADCLKAMEFIGHMNRNMDDPQLPERIMCAAYADAFEDLIERALKSDKSADDIIHMLNKHFKAADDEMGWGEPKHD